MRQGYCVQVGTEVLRGEHQVPSFEAGFDNLVKRYPEAAYLMLEEWGPGEDMVPILSRWEARNITEAEVKGGFRYLSALPTHRRVQS